MRSFQLLLSVINQEALCEVALHHTQSKYVRSVAMCLPNLDWCPIFKLVKERRVDRMKRYRNWKFSY